MYAFEDKGGRKIALRPEVTAAVVRAYVNEAQVAPKPLRWYYFAECFRYERPQKGRYRQFWQFGCELIGADSAAADAEVIALAYELLKSSGVRFVLKIGHLAPMKHMLHNLDAGEQKKVMAALDKRDMDLLKTTLDAIGHPDLYDPLTTLITEHAVWQQTYLHPVFILHLGMEDVRVWAGEGTRCVVFRRRYAPRVSRLQPAATLLVKLPEGLCPEALR